METAELLLYQNLSPEEIRRSMECSRMHTSSYSRNQIIFQQGDPADYLYVIRSGTVLLEQTSPAGRQTCLELLYENQCFGEIDVMQGGASKVKEAGAIIAGGHTIEDSEPKYGLCVTGFMHPDQVMQNSNCKEGDLLVLTKPLGIGVLTTANKAQLLDQQTYDQMVEAMATLNKYAKDVMMEVGANACTDVTGFGLIGHASEMAKGSGLTIELFSKEVPIIEAAIDFAKMGIIPSGAYNNMAFVKDDVRFAPDVPQHIQDLLVDPITSGGLLISLPEEKAHVLVEKLKGVTICNAIVGRVTAKQDRAIVVL